ncbi:hypothetical protein ZIOFF_025585 [Zingiber officinale]|uniref:Protein DETOXIFICATION n=1 Tax=Zingiber officinale TaxID=94328 RepID=A0A8J5GW44_ZINOF|nr:hypothetical protein ZIOFF_025585 [Zingiber officinale]
MSEHSSESTTIPQSSSHPTQITTIKLNGDNFLRWSQSVKMYIRGRGMMGYLTGEKKTPSEKDPMYATWDAENSMVMTWLVNSMEEEIGANYMCFPTAYELWENINQMYFDLGNQSQIFELTLKLGELRQGEEPVTKYFNSLKRIWQDLDLFDPYEWKNVEDGQYHKKTVEGSRIFKFLAGLNVEFDEVRGRIIGRRPLPSLGEVFSEVRREESRRNVMLGKKGPTTIIEGSALTSTGSNIRRGTANLRNEIIVFPCGFGISAAWIIDSGASDHMTNSLKLLKLYSPCLENKKFKIADGSFSPIAGKGSVQISENIDLKSVLYVPKLTCNLLSDRSSGKTIGSAKMVNGLYYFEDILPSKEIVQGLSSISSLSVYDQIMVWHCRLVMCGDPQRRNVLGRSRDELTIPAQASLEAPGEGTLNTPENDPDNLDLPIAFRKDRSTFLQAVLASAFARNDHTRAISSASRVLQWGMVLGLVLCIILGTGLQYASRLFTKDAEVLQLIHTGIPFVALTQPINALAFVFDGVNYGASDFAYSAYSMILVAIVSIACLVVLSSSYGFAGIWIALTIYMSLRMFAGFWRYINRAQFRILPSDVTHCFSASAAAWSMHLLVLLKLFLQIDPQDRSREGTVDLPLELI